MIKIKKNVDLYPFLTMRIHCLAEYFVDVETRDDLIQAKRFSLEKKVQFFIIGGGSNVVPLIKKIPGLVVLNKYKQLSIIKEGDDFVQVKVSSGYPVSLFVKKMIEKGYQGVEYHFGLPGTVGGAIYMNSKWTKPLSYFGDNLDYALIINNQGKIKQVDKKYFKFSYDYSFLQETKEILLEAVFNFRKFDNNILEKRAKESLDYRRKTQPMGVYSSGCFFKNINNQSVGYLIDQCGLKGYKVGGFSVSNKHANFIINNGRGKSEDLIKLLNLIKIKVKEKFGFRLEEEVILIH